jgi:raffinose/stachyose/melibiose transport system permease protein
MPDPRARHRRRGGARGGYVVPLLFLLPSFVLYAVFVLQPLGKTVELSFNEWDGLDPAFSFVGLDNYRELLTDDRFLHSLWRTGVWSILYICLAVGTGLLFASLIAQLRRGQTALRTLAFLPHVLSLAVVGVIWGQLLHPQIGIVNRALEGAGLGWLAQPWLGDQHLALPAVSIAAGWQAYGFYMVIFVASIQNIDPQLYEAASIDGAGAWQRFRHVTLPGLHNAITLVLTLAVINSLRGFDAVWAMTAGGPAHATELVAVYVWRVAFQTGRLGLAAAAGIVLTILVLAFAVVFNYRRDKE